MTYITFKVGYVYHFDMLIVLYSIRTAKIPCVMCDHDISCHKSTIPNAKLINILHIE
jgi:hypothetical protein